MNRTSNLSHSAQDREKSLRIRLGIPDNAKRIILFSESSHWDPSWMHTSEEYFEKFVCSNLDHALIELNKEPRRIYSVECAFFLRMYWERRPENQDAVRRLVNEGRLRLTSSGVTTDDTLLPDAEAIQVSALVISLLDLLKESHFKMFAISKALCSVQGKSKLMRQPTPSNFH